MRTLKFIVAALLAVVLSASINAQATLKTETFTVSGNCDMCKARIEKAARINGVTKAEWNDETKALTLVYDPAKVTSDDVQKKIAAVGHDTPKFKANAKVYEKLPECCKYR